MKQRWVILIAIVVTIAAIAMGLMALVRDTHRHLEQSNSDASLYQMRHSFLEYVSVTRRLPSAALGEGSSGPPHSWRTRINESFFGENHIDYSQPWDATENLLAAERPSVAFHRRRIRESSGWGAPTTDYVAVTGKGTAFPADEVVPYGPVPDGLENTVLVIEVEGSDIVWTNPVDIPLSDLRSLYDGKGRYSIESPHPDGPGLLFGDMAVFRMKEKLPFDVFRSLFTINGSEKWARSELVRRGYLTEVYPPAPISEKDFPAAKGNPDSGRQRKIELKGDAP